MKISIFLSVSLCVFLFACSPKLITTDSGLEYTVLQKNKKGVQIEEGMTVETQCVLTLTDGTKVWSTYDSNKPFTFEFGTTRMIDGFNEMISYMHEGEKVRVKIPSELGYGSRGAGNDIPPDSDLIFEIEVINIEK